MDRESFLRAMFLWGWSDSAEHTYRGRGAPGQRAPMDDEADRVYHLGWESQRKAVGEALDALLIGEVKGR